MTPSEVDGSKSAIVMSTDADFLNKGASGALPTAKTLPPAVATVPAQAM